MRAIFSVMFLIGLSVSLTAVGVMLYKTTGSFWISSIPTMMGFLLLLCIDFIARNEE